VRHAVRLVQGDLPHAAALGKLVAKAALPRPRLGDDSDDPRVPRDRLRERGLQRSHFSLPSDEPREAPRAGHVETGPHGRRPRA